MLSTFAQWPKHKCNKHCNKHCNLWVLPPQLGVRPNEKHRGKMATESAIDTWEDACQEATQGREPVGVACLAGGRGEARPRPCHSHNSQHRIPAPIPAHNTSFPSPGTIPSDPASNEDGKCGSNGQGWESPKIHWQWVTGEARRAMADLMASKLRRMSMKKGPSRPIVQPAPANTTAQGSCDSPCSPLSRRNMLELWLYQRLQCQWGKAFAGTLAPKSH